MKLDREIVDRFLAGQEIADSWVFSEIEEGRRCFDLSDATGREREIRELTQQVSERINAFVPENAEVYRQLFPNFQKELQEVQVCLTVGCPNPYDAMVMQREEDGIRHEVIVFDMARFLGYGERALGLVSRLTTHETAHILMHKRWPVLAEDVPYRRQLQHLCFDEGFAHLLACGEEIASFDFSGWVDQHWEPSLQKLREALACTEPGEAAGVLDQSERRALLGKVCLHHRQALPSAAPRPAVFDLQRGAGSIPPGAFSPLERK